MEAFADDLWFLSQKQRHFGYYLIQNDARQKGRYTINDLFENNEFHLLVQDTDSLKSDWDNMVFTFADFVKRFEVFQWKMMLLMSEIDEGVAFKHHKSNLDANPKYLSEVVQSPIA